MLVVSHLSKQYKKNVYATQDVSFQVLPGQIGILIGPNGAGKSTVIKSIAGLLRHEGTITIGGYPSKSIEAKGLLSYIPEIPAMYELLTAQEHLEFIARAYKINNYQSRMEELIHLFQLEEHKNKLGRELSKGMQQKVSICCALLTQPKVLLLDEPFVGLDPHAIKELKNALVRYKSQGCAILISTHMLDSVQDLWDTAAIMMKGRIVAVRQRNEETDQSLEDLFFSITEGRPSQEVTP